MTPEKNEHIHLARIEVRVAMGGREAFAIMKEPSTGVETPWGEKALLDNIKWMQQPENAMLRPPGMSPPEFYNALMELQAFKTKHGLPLETEKFEPPKKPPVKTTSAHRP